MSRTRRITTYLLIALGVVVTAAVGWVTGILEPGHLESVWGVDIGRVVERSPLLTLAVLLGIAVFIAVAQRMFEEKSEASRGQTVALTLQLRKELLSHLMGLYQMRLDDSLEHEVRLQLDMQRSGCSSTCRRRPGP